MASILGVTDDSRKVKPGWAFVAIKGLTSDGHDFIDEAVRSGASVVYGEDPSARFTHSGLHYVQVADSRAKLGSLASAFYGNPSHKLKVIGVTGTKGKTTTAHLIYHILTSAGKKVGLVSSIVARIGDKEVDTGFHVTSPDVVSLHNFLKEMVDADCEYAVIEVSSHGIDQQRIAGVKFEVGVLTNIAPEHLDYHKTFKAYKRVKMAFINSCKHKIIAPKETELAILSGKFNNLNAEAALKTVEIFGISREQAIKSLDAFELPKGRLEKIENSLGIKIFVDFAHTPDSLEAALNYLRTQTQGKLISVFGCAGERDHKKRRKMGKISSTLADLSVFTAEDPRSEKITDIFRLMTKEARNFICIPERGEAVAYALSIAKPGDTVGFFGKGHETSMAYYSSSDSRMYEHPWSDQKAIKDYLDRDTEISAIVLAAGKGTRMHSNIPKVLHEICGRPMISYSLENLRNAKVGEIIMVLSYKRNQIEKAIRGTVKIAVQKNPKGGTGQATKYGLEEVNPGSKYVMVFYGDDSAFFRSETIRGALAQHIKDRAIVSFASAIVENPFGLGRVLRDSSGQVLGIVEEKAANEEQKKIKEINCGNFIFNRDWLLTNIHRLEKSASGEYYINNLIQAAIDQGEKVCAYKLKDRWEWQGINTPEELDHAKQKMAEKLR